ncbi:unnamed protein product [Amaranthus hypochondriacus]
MSLAQDHAASKDEVAMNELIKQANKSRPQDEMIFGGWLYNKSSTHKPLHLFDEKTWSGDFFNKYPNDIEESASFVQTAKKENGIKNAVVYSRKTGEDPSNHYGYLLAWSDSVEDGNNIRKAYGYCGLLNKFINIDWKKVEKSLDEASPSFSFIDAYTRTSIKARIVANVVYAEFN